MIELRSTLISPFLQSSIFNREEASVQTRTMGKDKEEKRVKDKKEKKEKKEKRSEVDGVKKSKKEKKAKVNGDISDALEKELEKEPEESMVNVVENGDAALRDIPKSALVPIAEPLCEDTKDVKKVLKTVKKCELYSGNRSQALNANNHTSGQDQDPPPWCQGSCQVPPQVIFQRAAVI